MFGVACIHTKACDTLVVEMKGGETRVSDIGYAWYAHICVLLFLFLKKEDFYSGDNGSMDLDF